ncbi:hypothetical protein T06_16407 [Trichinella sp. T6]|nr:hypothetical protein T06_16407 [Trichinella sp. T6]
MDFLVSQRPPMDSLVSHRPHIDYLVSQPPHIEYWCHIDPNGFLGVTSTPKLIKQMSSSKGIDIWLEISEFQAQVSKHF